MKPAPFIFVCQRGFVYIARMDEEQNDSLTYLMTDFAVIRAWGTTKGLGELAIKGPLPGTILDPEPAGVKVSRLDIKRQIPCDKKAWEKWGDA